MTSLSINRIHISSFVILFIAYVAIFRLFSNTPVEVLGLVYYYPLAGIFTAFWLAYLFQRWFGNQLNKADIVAVLVVVPYLMAVFTAWSTFSQPLYWGVFSVKSAFISSITVGLIFILRKRRLRFENLEKSLVWFAVLYLALALLLYAMPASFYAGESMEKFAVFEQVRGLRLKFQNIVLIFLFFYSYSAARKSDFFKIVLLALIVYFVILNGGRSNIIAIFLVIFLKNVSFKYFLSFLKRAVMILVGIALLLFVFKQLLPTQFQGVVNSFSSLLSLSGAGASVGADKPDVSLTARINEVAIAIQYILQNPLFGNGLVHSNYNGGFEEMFGYFYPADIGILGNLFAFGIVGTLLLYLPIIHLITDKSRKVWANDPFTKSMEMTLMYLYIKIQFTAFNMTDLSSLIFFYLMLYYAKEVKERNMVVGSLNTTN